MVAVIDIGSNSVRLLIRDGKNTIYKDHIITKLASNRQGNILDGESIKRTVDAVAFFVNKAKAENVPKENIFAFGTAALRSADNSSVFIESVYKLSDMQVEIISGEKEARLGLLGVLNNGSGGIIDIGGASTEIIISNGNMIKYSKSLNVGVVTIDNEFKQNPVDIERFASDKVKEYGVVPKCKMFGIGGTITSVASMIQSLRTYDSEKITGFVIKKIALNELIDRVEKMTIPKREKIVGIEPKRATTILGGLIWLKKIMEYLSVEEITASDSDNLEGYLIEKGLYD